MDGGDLEALNEKSRAPRLKRKRLWPKEVTEEIRRLRTLYPNLSKEKLYPVMKLFCEQRKLSSPKARTIGRIIADQPDKMCSRPIKVRSNGQRIERKKRPKGRKPKGYKASPPGQCGAFDTVEYFLDGIRRYVSHLPITTLDSLLPGPRTAMRLWLPESSLPSSLMFFLLRFSPFLPITGLSL